MVTSNPALEYCRCQGEIAKKQLAKSPIFSLNNFLLSKKIPKTPIIPKNAAGNLTPHSFRPNKLTNGTAE